MNERPVIGVVGGVGPYASLDLAAKIFDQTIAGSDQEHLPVILLSMPHAITDRTAFLLGQTDANPAYALAEIIRKLEAAGADVAGIPCNTAHSPRIFDVIVEELAAAGSRIRLVHMIREMVRFLAESYPTARKVGVLCTTGTARTEVYPALLTTHGIAALLPDEPIQEAVQSAIYDRTYGIKVRSSPVTERARRQLLQAVAHLQDRGAEVLLLGCTEIPLAIPERRIGSTAVLDPTLILARALIRETYPAKLRPFVET
jgi:aspartate racemase